MKKNIIYTKLLILIPFLLIISCASGSKTYNECQEKCEYNRRYCMDNCGGGNRAGFSFDIKGSETTKPYSCQEKCENTSNACTKLCEP